MPSRNTQNVDGGAPRPPGRSGHFSELTDESAYLLAQHVTLPPHLCRGKFLPRPDNEEPKLNNQKAKETKHQKQNW